MAVSAGGPNTIPGLHVCIDPQNQGRQLDGFCSDSQLISVVIPCYNQAHFVGEAIESVLAQNYSNVEVILVDDGSTDNTHEVSRSYSQVHYFHQKNQGLSAARNTGIEVSRGNYLVFLDADDRLLPEALLTGLHHIQSNPETAFVSGRYRMIEADGSIKSEHLPYPIESEHYLAFLRGNFIGMHAAVMYRRSALESVGGFNSSLAACEDYDLYLRISRIHPIYCHNTLIAEYRQHHDSMSTNLELMLKTSVAALKSQWRYIEKDKQHKRAYRKGMRYWVRYYGKKLVRQSCIALLRGEINRSIKSLLTVTKYASRYYF